MSRIRLYLDENIQVALADALRARGVDVLTTFKAGNVGLSDFINFSSQLNQKERFLPIIKEILQSSIMLNWQKIENTLALFYPTSFQSKLFFVDL